MQHVTVSRRDLYAKMEKNRDNHAEELEAAQREHREARRKELAEWQLMLERGEDPPRYSALPDLFDARPEYDRVLAMLAMSTEEVIRLSASEFSQYVLDEWHWRHALKESRLATQSYLKS